MAGWWRRRGEREQSDVAKEVQKDDAAPPRRAALRQGLASLRQLGARATSGEGYGAALMRPPGSGDAAAFYEACTRCGACVEACHQNVIRVADARHGVRAGTPYLDVNNYKPCYMCTRLVCAEACPSGALEHGLQAHEIRLGTARVLRQSCLAWKGETCDRCYTTCPLPDVAILRSDDGRVVIDPRGCTGCGLCVMACPTHPRSIRVQVRS